jgi:hypothetical protein
MTTPVATTFYSHRIFLSYLPDDYRKYLREVVDKSKWNAKTKAEQFQLELGLFAWGTILVYRSRMVPFHFNRELKRLVDEKGKFLEENPATIPLTRGIYRQQLAMQLGIEAIMRREKVKERIAEVPAFQQYTYDTLYWPSYQHEKGLNDGQDEEGNPKRFVFTLDSLREYLWFRAKGTRRLRDENFPPDDIAIVLFDALEEYFKLLKNPSLIQQETIAFARQLADEGKQRLWIALAKAIQMKPFVNTFEVSVS